ncbi:MAG: NAD(P)(+) transhydrogenase (Re/Si-specific) subunit beta [Acidobacteria bacterium]|nr:NAD(P)(+) transhydrogenase (Re/Si-specific) subunit beta [Acidobacteriota bacterium]
MSGAIVNLAYLVASILFIVGLKGLGHPRTAVRGNLIGAVGMLLAVLITVTDQHIVSYQVMLAGVLVGSAAGALLSEKTPMTGMPQMVALLNGFGGGASTLVAGAALVEELGRGSELSRQFTIATAASALIGAVTFWGSLVAFAKLQEMMSGNAVVFRGQHVLNAAVALACVGLGLMVVASPEATWNYWLLVAVSSVLGVLTTIPIGGADMPVVISLLNSYSGLAGAATGFVLNNNMLIIAGALVGASGIILCQVMCRAMNRSLSNVLFGGLGAASFEKMSEDTVYAGKVKASSPEEVSMLLENARRVIVVPGYGMAVSQAQHALEALARLLEDRGTEVLYAIHPVAGRMPGHMNVLLAEADVPYDRMKDLDESNPLFPQTDVVIVIGANDVVNPVARTDPKSPIAGMPIMDVDKARVVVVIKRSLSSGFAGIPNPLFAADNTVMLFADGRKAVNDLVFALKEAR